MFCPACLGFVKFNKKMKFRKKLFKLIIYFSCLTSYSNLYKYRVNNTKYNLRATQNHATMHLIFFTSTRTAHARGICRETIRNASLVQSLTVLPAIERVLHMYAPLKSYFLSKNKCPVLLSNFFENDSSEFWLKFLHHQASTFHDTVKKLEVDTINFSEVREIIFDLKNKYKNRLDQNYVPLILKSELTALIEQGQIDEKYCMGHICNFYSNIVEYLNKYSEQYTNFKVVSYMKLTEAISWNIVQDSFQYFIENINNDLIKEDQLFDEISYVSNYVTSDRIEKWTQESFTTERRWLEVFKFLNEHNLPFNNCLILVQYMLAVPGTNAPTERVFSCCECYMDVRENYDESGDCRCNFRNKVQYGYLFSISESIKRGSRTVKKIHSVEK